MGYITLLLKIKKDIDRASVVSFDIFDTLLLRPYLRPTDLFLHIEKVKNMPCFCGARIEAEHEARRKNPSRENIAFDQSYDEIDDVFKPLKQTELDWEMQVLRQNPEMKQVWDYAKSAGKKIVVASDMYLPADFLARVLKKNGFGDYDKLYVSGECGKTKSHGSLYPHICNEMKIAAGDILHIGDNKNADFRRALEKGVRAILYRQVSEQYFEHDKRAAIFRKSAGGDLGMSIMMSIMAWRWQKRQLGLIKSDYWTDLGYEYAGHVIYGYTRWIERQTRDLGVDHLLFVARDGYTLQKVFATFDSGIKTSYVYAPRFLNLICRLDYEKQNKKQPGAIIDYFSGTDPEIRMLAQKSAFCKWSDYHEFIQQNRYLFVKKSATERDNYKNYLKNISHVDGCNVGIVDTITYGFSSQKLLQDMMGVQAVGFYWAVMPSIFKDTFNHRQFVPNADPRMAREAIYTKRWEFMEFLMTSPELPIKNVSADGQPVYDANPTEYEQRRKDVYPSVSNGGVAFAEDIKEILGGSDIFLDSATIIEWINCFCDYPTKQDMAMMSGIQHAAENDHQDYLPLFWAPLSFRYVARHPFKALKIARTAIWRSPLQTIAVCACNPLKIKTRGIKYIGLHLLPKLRRQYLSFHVRLTDRWHYHITIGAWQQ